MGIGSSGSKTCIRLNHTDCLCCPRPYVPGPEPTFMVPRRRCLLSAHEISRPWSLLFLCEHSILCEKNSLV